MKHGWRSARCLFVLVAACLHLSSREACAQTLYGITWTNELITINPATGAATLVGVVPTNMQSAGIGFRGTQLYAWDNNARRIREINPATAAIVNTIDIGVNFFGEGDLVFRSDGVGFLCGFAPAFHRFDVTAPSSTALPALTATMDGLAFNASDVLYGLSEGAPSSRLYTIDPVTGVATLIGDTGIAGNPSGGLAFDPAGNLYAAFGNGNAQIYRINPATAAATLVGSNSFGITGIRFGPAAATAGVTITPSGGSTTIAEGGASDTYTVVLNSAPTANVMIALNPGTQATVTPPTLTFTPANWNVAQTVTVTAVDDALVEGAHTGTISHTATSTDTAYNGIAIGSVTVNITDNDAGPPVPPPSPSSLLAPTGTNEGTYPGAGLFGSGGRMARYQPGVAILEVPVSAGASMRVRNVSARSAVSAAANEDVDFGPVGISMLLAAFGGGIFLAARKVLGG